MCGAWCLLQVCINWVVAPVCASQWSGCGTSVCSARDCTSARCPLHARIHTPRTLCPYMWAAAVVAVSLESPVVQQASVHDPCTAIDTHCQGSTIRLPSWTGSVCGPALPTLHSPPCTPQPALPTLPSQMLAAVQDGFIWYFLFEASGCHTCPSPPCRCATSLALLRPECGGTGWTTRWRSTRWPLLLQHALCHAPCVGALVTDWLCSSHRPHPCPRHCGTGCCCAGRPTSRELS